jgi:hypothetical protein
VTVARGSMAPWWDPLRAPDIIRPFCRARPGHRDSPFSSGANGTIVLPTRLSDAPETTAPSSSRQPAQPTSGVICESLLPTQPEDAQRRRAGLRLGLSTWPRHGLLERMRVGSVPRGPWSCYFPKLGLERARMVNDLRPRPHRSTRWRSRNIQWFAILRGNPRTNPRYRRPAASLSPSQPRFEGVQRLYRLQNGD